MIAGPKQDWDLRAVARARRGCQGKLWVAVVRLLAAVSIKVGLLACVRGDARVWCTFVHPLLRSWHVLARSYAVVLFKDGELNASMPSCSCKHVYAIDTEPLAQLQVPQGTVADAVVRLVSAASEFGLEVAQLPASIVYCLLSKSLAWSLKLASFCGEL
jgi:hypothetical protein